MRFGARLTLFLVVVLISVQTLTVGAGHVVSREQLVERGKAQLERAAQVFERKLDLVLQRIADSVSVLALDYPLREAIAQQDLATAASALNNHGGRIGARRMFLVDLDGTLLLDTVAGTEHPTRFAFPEMLDEVAANGSAAGMAVIEGKLNWLIGVPVNAPVPIAYIAAVVPVDDALVATLRDLDALPISIKIRAAGGVALAAATIPGSANAELLQSTLDLRMLKGSERAVAVFEYPLTDAVAPFNAVLWPLLIISLAGLGVAIAGAALIAREVSRPIETLAASARQIEGGDYTPPSAIKGAKEITDLSQALGAMARAIGERRTELQNSRDEAWRASKAKSEFLANMSHEIRTPLNAVLGLAGVLIDSPLNDEQRRQVALIKESGDNLLGLLNDLLDLSKLDAGQVELETSAFNAVALARGSVDLLHARAVEKGIALNFEASGEIPVAVIGDSGRVRQVLVNLVGNAIKFTQAGGVVVRMASTPAQGDRAIVEWSVSDTGIGIPSERIDSLFQDFVQADSSISRRFGGTGLGLAICKRLVARMGGTIEVKSTVGQGSTFTFRVPLAVATAPAEATQSRRQSQDLAAFVAARGRCVRILVVEDNMTNQFVARSILKVDGIHIDVAGNGLEAIDSVTRHDYDLVFMDLQMPEMDGLTATKLLRARGGRFAALPIVAFSANAYASDVEACAEAGMNGHVAKPVQKETLQQAVIDALSGRSANGASSTSSEHNPDASDFDRSAVDALIEGLTAEVVGELLTSFVQDTRAKLERLPELLDNYERLAVEVHALKSAGAQVGAMRLSKLATALERRALQRDPITADELTPLKSTLDRYSAQLGDIVRVRA